MSRPDDGPQVKIVSSAEVFSTPGRPLLAGYWLRRQPGETITDWRKRETTERAVAHTQAHLAHLGGLGNPAPDCATCHGSGITWDGAHLILCPNNTPPREEGP